MPESPAPATPFPFLPRLPDPPHNAAAPTLVPLSLAGLGCTTLQQFALRQVDHLRDLGNASDLAGLVDCQTRFAQTLWQDQQQAVQRALQILGLDGEAASPAEAPNGPATPDPEPESAAAAPDSRPVPETAAGADRRVTRQPRSRKTAAQKRRSRTGKRAAKAVYELYLDDDGDHRFRLKGADGTVLLISKPYKSRASAVNGIDVVRRNAANDERYVTAQDPQDGPTFELRAGNSRVISSSTPFSSEAEMEAGLAMVKRVAGSARIKAD